MTSHSYPGNLKRTVQDLSQVGCDKQGIMVSPNRQPGSDGKQGIQAGVLKPDEGKCPRNTFDVVVTGAAEGRDLGVHNLQTVKEEPLMEYGKEAGNGKEDENENFPMLNSASLPNDDRSTPPAELDARMNHSYKGVYLSQNRRQPSFKERWNLPSIEGNLYHKGSACFEHETASEDDLNDLLRQSFPANSKEKQKDVQKEKKLPNRSMGMGILGEEMSPAVLSMRYDWAGNLIGRKDKLAKEKEARDAAAWYHFFAEKDVNELIIMATLTKKNRKDILQIAEILPSKLNQENNGESKELVPSRIDAFRRLLERILEETNGEMRVALLGMVIDILHFYEDEFIKLCDPQVKLVSTIDTLLAEHSSRPGNKEKDHWEFMEFQFLMEISEWVEGALTTIRWYGPLTNPMAHEPPSSPHAI